LERDLRGSLLLVFLLLTVGCARQASDKGLMLSELDSVTPCCSDYSELGYVNLNSAKKEFSINATSQVFNFSTGNSFVLALDISSFSGVNRVRVTSKVQNTAFFPIVEVLNENFQVIAGSSNESTEFVHPSSFTDGYYRVRVNEIDKNASYLLVYTSRSKLDKATPRINYSSTLAELGQTQANIDSLVSSSIPFSSIGKVIVSVETDGLEKGVVDPSKNKSIKVSAPSLENKSTQNISLAEVGSIDEYRAQLTSTQIDNNAIEIIEAIDVEQYQRAILLINRADDPSIARKVFTDVIKLRNK
jgi:hypothetical protein